MLTFEITAVNVPEVKSETNGAFRDFRKDSFNLWEKVITIPPCEFQIYLLLGIDEGIYFLAHRYQKKM